MHLVRINVKYELSIGAMLRLQVLVGFFATGPQTVLMIFFIIIFR